MQARSWFIPSASLPFLAIIVVMRALHGDQSVVSCCPEREESRSRRSTHRISSVACMIVTIGRFLRDLHITPGFGVPTIWTAANTQVNGGASVRESGESVWFPAIHMY